MRSSIVVYLPMRFLTQFDIRCGLFLLDLGRNVVTSVRTFFLFRLLLLSIVDSLTPSSSSSSLYICLLLLLWIFVTPVLLTVCLNSRWVVLSVSS